MKLGVQCIEPEVDNGDCNFIRKQFQQARRNIKILKVSYQQPYKYKTTPKIELVHINYCLVSVECFDESTYWLGI